MRTITVASAALFAVLGVATAAQAEETTVVEKNSGPSVTVERREGVVERRDVTTDCGSKTVHKEDGAGNSTTVHKEGCN